MKCPKCEEGELKKIVLTRHNTTCLLCEFCNTFWEEDERVNQSTGKPFQELSEGDMREFHIAPTEGQDQEHSDAKYTKER